jgi:hypothetical protein
MRLPPHPARKRQDQAAPSQPARALPCRTRQPCGRNAHEETTMRQLASQYRRLSWLVVLALLFGACAPMLSQIVENRFSSPWDEICGSRGNEISAGLTPTRAPNADKALAKFDSCEFCALLHHAPPLPVKITPWQALSFWFGRIRRTKEVCRGYKRFRRRAHRSRAPPSCASCWA